MMEHLSEAEADELQRLVERILTKINNTTEDDTADTRTGQPITDWLRLDDIERWLKGDGDHD
jgi:Asp-tRNA(Asn)/Glu-tRNA(Gln) amidotransferase C subunit